jgi:hydrogenase maturation protein HypF
MTRRGTGSGSGGIANPKARRSGKLLDARPLQRGKSSGIVRTAELVRRLDSDSSPARAPTSHDRRRKPLQNNSPLASTRLRLLIGGSVQGVGFRPYVYRLAGEMGLAGWVANDPAGVVIEVEGTPDRVERFVERLVRERPTPCEIVSLERERVTPVGDARFEIRASDESGMHRHPAAPLPPDLATCEACRHELFDPADRRYRYPFLNCTDCGPRYTIVKSLPYDRMRTVMRCFTMCPACQGEYLDPTDRRFHAQPNACPECGPRLALWDGTGRPLAQEDDALLAAVDALREGRIVAVKGLGGFHLMADGGNEAAVQRLRARKRRPEKPFALLFPSLEAVEQVCEVSPFEARLLRSPEAPIVLLRSRSQTTLAQVRGSAALRLGHGRWPCRRLRFRLRRRGLRSFIHTPLGVWGHRRSHCTGRAPTDKSSNPHRRTPRSTSSLGDSRPPFSIAPSVAPRNPHLGIMLPSTPLQHLLMAELGVPVIATSGNRSDEPICIDNEEALARLQGIADLFLVHDRPIARPVDDSVVRTVMGRELVLRRARGYAPRPVSLGRALPTAPIIAPMIAMGGHLKSTVAISVGDQAVISQHLGDLGSAEACMLHRRTVNELPSFHRVRPAWAVCDLHPDYRSTLEAVASGLPVFQVQHHHAHVAACMAEHHVRGLVLGVAWDGTGYGPDGTMWGGEFLLADECDCNRFATIRRFRLPGGERAMKEPWRTAVGLLWELWGEALFEHDELACVNTMTATEKRLLRLLLARGVHAPETSSVGRLFDAVASITGLRQLVSFDGQAAMGLEFAAEREQTDERYPVCLTERTSNGHASSAPQQGREHNKKAGLDERVMIIDWEPMATTMLDDIRAGVGVGAISAKFHNTLAEIVVTVARRVGLERVVLSGGCFQNRRLLEGTVGRLRAAGFHPFWPHRVPPNDGGLALGQLYIAMGKQKTMDSGEWTVASGQLRAGR